MYRRDLPGAGVPKPTLPPRSLTPISMTSSQPDSLPSFSEINQQFLDAQEDRVKVFESSRRQQRIAFLEAIAAHDDGKDKRDKEFSRLLEEIKITYITARKERDVTFDASEAKRDSLFSVQESTRQSLFNAAQADRKHAVQQVREQHQQLVNRLVQQRQALFSNGRAKRQNVFDEVERCFTLFDEIMETQDAAFFATQAQRDARIDTIVQVS